MGATVNFTGQILGNMATNYITTGKVSLKKAISDVDIFDVCVSGIEGALTCGASSIAGIGKSAGKKVGAKLGLGLLSNAVQSSVDIKLDNEDGQYISNSINEVVVETCIGVIGDNIPVNINGTHLFGDTVSNNKTANAARKIAHKNGESLSSSEAQQIAKMNTRINSQIAECNCSADAALSSAPATVMATATNSIFGNLNEK